jgi:predicted TIM-barrel fold metal-dependent hydrolase
MILIHTWGNNDPHNGPRHIKMIADKYKNATFIMGHSAPGELDEAIEVARTHDNVMLDLCDIHRHSGIVDKMVEGVGADKVLFGTDIPWYDPSYCLGSVLFSHISDEDKYKVIYGNAKKIADRFRK